RQISRIQKRTATERGGKQCLCAALPFFLALLVFWPSRSDGFVGDDHPYNLAGNPALMRCDFAAFWEHPYRDFYIPVSYSVWTAVAELNSEPLAAGALLPAACAMSH